MKRATVTAARSVQPFTRSFASSSSRHAGDWDRAKSTDNTLAHALNFVSGRTRLTQPSATAYNTVLKQALDHSDQYDTKYAVEPVSGRHVELQSLPFDIAINAIAEAEKERVTLGEEAAELISRVRIDVLSRTHGSLPADIPRSYLPCCWRQLKMETIQSTLR